MTRGSDITRNNDGSNESDEVFLEEVAFARVMLQDFDASSQSSNNSNESGSGLPLRPWMLFPDQGLGFPFVYHPLWLSAAFQPKHLRPSMPEIPFISPSSNAHRNISAAHDRLAFSRVGNNPVDTGQDFEPLTGDLSAIFPWVNALNTPSTWDKAPSIDINCDPRYFYPVNFSGTPSFLPIFAERGPGEHLYSAVEELVFIIQGLDRNNTIINEFRNHFDIFQQNTPLSNFSDLIDHGVNEDGTERVFTSRSSIAIEDLIFGDLAHRRFRELGVAIWKLHTETSLPLNKCCLKKIIFFSNIPALKWKIIHLSVDDRGFLHFLINKYNFVQLG